MSELPRTFFFEYNPQELLYPGHSMISLPLIEEEPLQKQETGSLTSAIKKILESANESTMRNETLTQNIQALMIALDLPTEAYSFKELLLAYVLLIQSLKKIGLTCEQINSVVLAASSSVAKTMLTMSSAFIPAEFETLLNKMQKQEPDEIFKSVYEYFQQHPLDSDVQKDVDVCAELFSGCSIQDKYDDSVPSKYFQKFFQFLHGYLQISPQHLEEIFAESYLQFIQITHNTPQILVQVGALLENQLVTFAQDVPTVTTIIQRTILGAFLEKISRHEKRDTGFLDEFFTYLATGENTHLLHLIGYSLLDKADSRIAKQMSYLFTNNLLSTKICALLISRFLKNKNFVLQERSLIGVKLLALCDKLDIEDIRVIGVATTDLLNETSEVDFRSFSESLQSFVAGQELELTRDISTNPFTTIEVLHGFLPKSDVPHKCTYDHLGFHQRNLCTILLMLLSKKWNFADSKRLLSITNQSNPLKNMYRENFQNLENLLITISTSLGVNTLHTLIKDFAHYRCIDFCVEEVIRQNIERTKTFKHKKRADADLRAQKDGAMQQKIPDFFRGKDQEAVSARENYKRSFTNKKVPLPIQIKNTLLETAVEAYVCIENSLLQKLSFQELANFENQQIERESPYESTVQLINSPQNTSLHIILRQDGVQGTKNIQIEKPF